MRLRIRRHAIMAALALLGAACGGRVLVESAEALDGGALPTGVMPGSRDLVPDAAVQRPDAARAPRPTLPDSAQRFDLGTHESGETVTFVVPPNTLGFSLIAVGDPTDLVSIDALVSPSGETLFKDGRPKGTDVDTAVNFGWATAAVPQPAVYPNSPVEPGTWKVTLGSSALGLPKVRLALVTQRTSDGFFHGGELDLEVFIPKGLVLSQPGPRHEVTIAGAATDPELNARIDAFYDLLEQVLGIGRGNVRYHGIDGRHAAIDLDSDAVYEAFRQTAGTPAGQALRVVFANELGGALGVAPAVPGNPLEPGTSLSAIAVTQAFDTSPELDAFTILHEMGHFGGLSHTTEFKADDFPLPDGGTYLSDPLPDTPTCDGGVTQNNVLGCPDFKNVMFPTGDQETGILSGLQLRVLRGSAVYRAKSAGRIVAPPRTPIQHMPSFDRLPADVRRCLSAPRRPR